MSGQHAKIRIQEVRNNLQNAIEAGAVVQPKDARYGVTFHVAHEQNLLSADGYEAIKIDSKQSITEIKEYSDIIQSYQQFDTNTENIIQDMANELNDAGLILGKPESLKFLYSQFSNKLKRTHDNFRAWTNLFQCFLNIIYWRRYHRVMSYIRDNTDIFKDVARDEVYSLTQQGQIRLNRLRDKMRVCKAVCKTDQNEMECYYLCLLCSNHENDNDWEDQHCLV